METWLQKANRKFREISPWAFSILLAAVIGYGVGVISSPSTPQVANVEQATLTVFADATTPDLSNSTAAVDGKTPSLAAAVTTAEANAELEGSLRYEILLPYENDNQAYYNARQDWHLDSGQLWEEMLRQLDRLDVSAHIFPNDVILNSEGPYRAGRYTLVVFDAEESRTDAVVSMFRDLGRSVPSGFIHMKAYTVEVMEYGN